MNITIKTYNEVSMELLSSHRRVLELLIHDRPLEEILRAIVEAAEASAPGCRIGLYFVEDGVMKLGAAPGMPDDFVSVIHGCRTGLNRGVCGTASFTGRRTISTNVSRDEVWGDFTGWALSFGIKSAWSNPVVSPTGGVIATVSFYYNYLYEPTLWDFEIGDTAAQFLGLAAEIKKKGSLLKRMKMANAAQLASLASEISTPLDVILEHALYLKLLCQRDPLLPAEVALEANEIEKSVKQICGLTDGLK